MPPLHPKAVDTSNFTLNTPVLVYIRERGVWIPEVKGYPPIRCYISIEDVITILNRGISVEFPNQSPKKEISLKIEEIMLSYNEAKHKASKERGMDVGTDISQALKMIQDFNDTKTSVEKAVETPNEQKSIFDFSDRAEGIMKRLNNSNFISKMLKDDPGRMNAEDRLKAVEKERKVKEETSKYKKELLEDFALESEALDRLLSNAKYTTDDMLYDQLDFSESIRDFENFKKSNKPTFLKKKPSI